MSEQPETRQQEDPTTQMFALDEAMNTLGEARAAPAPDRASYQWIVDRYLKIAGVRP